MDCGKQPVREHGAIGGVVVKKPSGSLTEHIESSKSTAGGSGDCKASQQELPPRRNPLLKHPTPLELFQNNTESKLKTKTLWYLLPLKDATP